MSDKEYYSIKQLCGVTETDISEGNKTVVPSGQRFQSETALKANTRIQHQEVDKMQDDQKKEGEVLTAMKSVAAESVLFMVNDPAKVKAALEILYKRTGTCKHSGADLMAVVLVEEEHAAGDNVI